MRTPALTWNVGHSSTRRENRTFNRQTSAKALAAKAAETEATRATDPVASLKSLLLEGTQNTAPAADPAASISKKGEGKARGKGKGSFDDGADHEKTAADLEQFAKQVSPRMRACVRACLCCAHVYAPLLNNLTPEEIEAEGSWAKEQEIEINTSIN